MELQRNYSRITPFSAEVLAISTDDLGDARWVIDNIGVPFPILYDESESVPKAYGVFDHFGDGLATGSIFIIDAEGLIRWSKIYTHSGDFVSANQILEALGAL